MANTRTCLSALIIGASALPMQAQTACETISEVAEAAVAALPFAAFEAKPGAVSRLQNSIGSASYCYRQAENDQPAMRCSAERSNPDRYTTDQVAALRTEYFDTGSRLILAIKDCPGFETWQPTRDEITALEAQTTAKDVRLTDPVTGKQIISRTEVSATGSKGRYSYTVLNALIFPSLAE